MQKNKAIKKMNEVLWKDPNGFEMQLSESIFCKDKKLPNVLLIGSAGTGTSTFVQKMLKNANGDMNYVVIDSRGEMYRKTEKDLREKGYQIKVFAGKNVTKDVKTKDFVKFSPLSYVESNKDILDFANILTSGNSEKKKGPFWQNGERIFCKNLLVQTHKEGKQEYQNFAHICDLIDNGAYDTDALCMSEKAKTGLIISSRQAFEDARLVEDATKEHEELDFDSMKKRKTVLFIELSPFEACDPVIAMLIREIYKQLGDSTEKRHTMILFHEFEIVKTKLPNMKKMITLSNPKFVNTCVIAQSIREVLK